MAKLNSSGARDSDTRLFKIWCGIKKRCLSKNAANYHRYGGRGIVVCREWTKFSAFKLWALGNGYADTLTIERKDNDGNYCPENCCWIPRSHQNRNRSSCHLVRAFGETKTILDWLSDPRCAVDRPTLSSRLNLLGWDAETAIMTAPHWSALTHRNKPTDQRSDRTVTAFGEIKTLTDWARDSRCAVGYPTLWRRVVYFHWDAERAITMPARVWPSQAAS